MSDFLKNLKESLEKGEKSEAVQSTFETLLTKAEEKSSDFNTVEKVDAKVQQVVEQRKPLTAEEIKEIEFQAMKQQQKIDEFEYNGMLSAALVNIDLAIEKLTNKITNFKASSTLLRDESLPVAEKKKLMKEVLKEINNIEAHITPPQKFTLGNNDAIYAEKI